ncbi:MAG: sigma-54 dependent transcriptional regulator [Polaromonas sp.]
MSPSLIAQQALWLDPFQPLADAVQAQLAAGGLTVHPVATLEELQSKLAAADLVVVRLGDNIELLQELQALTVTLGFAVPIVCRVDRRHLELVVAAMRQGALHVLPADDLSMAAWQSVRALREAAQSPTRPVSKVVRPPRSVVYVDPASQHLFALAQRVAMANVTALIEGPTGAGKEVLARVLHESSDRARGPFVALNCAALPEHLIEDMLFGHEKGAFTGAHKEHHGMFEQAQGGTLFLDEIAEMPIHLQAKLLRVLQERQIVRLGGERPIDLDVRLVVATNKDLRAAIAAREFREDLYFRISTFKLRVPPLRERPGDILPLVARLLARHANNNRVMSINAQAQACLQAYAWPGNVRELENVVLRALVLCTEEVITPAHLMFDDAMPLLPQMPQMPQVALMPPLPVVAAAPVIQSAEAFYAAPLPDFLKADAGWNAEAMLATAPSAQTASLQAAVKSNEHQLIMAAIQTTFSRMEAARKLGISPRTLRYKLAKLKGQVAMSTVD